MSPWGDVLSIGVTYNQQKCEEEIITRTKFYTNQCFKTRKCISAHYCSFDFNRLEPNHTHDILRIFHLASRGKFLNTPWPFKTKKESSNFRYFAPWLNPTQEWFSLSMYLVSRFEVSLHHSYLQQNNNITNIRAIHPCQTLKDQFYSIFSNNNRIWRKCILDSIRKNIIYHLRLQSDHYCNTIHNKKDNHVKNDNFMIRDCIWYQIMNEHFVKSHSSPLHITNDNSNTNGINDHVPIDILLDNVISISLIEIGTGYDVLKKTLCSILYETIVNASEKCLLSHLDSIDVDGVVDVDDDGHVDDDKILTKKNKLILRNWPFFEISCFSRALLYLIN